MKRHELKVVRKGEKVPFTVGALVESLQGVGITTDEAISLARGLEKRYRQEGTKEVELDELLKTLLALVEKAYGAESAERLRQQTPPFVPLKVRSGEEEVPFSRRSLMGFLEKQGFSFKEANVLARQVEGELRAGGLERVTPPDIARQTALSVEARFGREARARFEAKTGQPTELVVLEEGGARLPYSRGILAQSLMALGLGPELSHGLAKRTEVLLWRSGAREVDRETLRGAVKRLLLQEAGEEFVRRYELLRSVRRPDKPIVILIGGAPGVGKSTLAAELAYRLGIPRLVASDSVRQALRSLISAELSPALHTSSFTAWRAELLPSEFKNAKPKRKRVVRGFQRQVQQLTTALQAIIGRSVEEATSLVLEGIHFVPGFMPLDDPEVTVVELVLMVSDPELHRSYFGVREVQTHNRRLREHYLEHFDEIRILQDFIVERAQAEGVPVLEASDFDQTVEGAVEGVLSAVLVERAEPLTQELAALSREVSAQRG